MTGMPRSGHFRTLVAKQPGNELFHFSLASALASEGQLEEALTHFRFCAEKKADWMMPRIQLGKILLQLKRPAEARPVLEDALRLAIDQSHEDPEVELRALLEGLS